jgi:hypothetical protein
MHSEVYWSIREKSSGRCGRVAFTGAMCAQPMYKDGGKPLTESPQEFSMAAFSFNAGHVTKPLHCS